MNNDELVIEIRKTLDAVMYDENKIKYIRNLLNQDFQTNNLMTRIEAINLYAKVRTVHTDYAESEIKALEALGLIKFKEEPKFNAYQEAVNYLNSGQGYRLAEVGNYHKMIKGLVDIINERYKDD